MKVKSDGIKGGHSVVLALIIGMSVGAIIDILTNMFPTFLGTLGLTSALIWYGVLRYRQAT